MIPKSGYRFSEKIMLLRNEAGMFTAMPQAITPEAIESFFALA